MKYRRNPFGDFFEIQKQVDQRFDSFFQEPSASSTLAARSDHWRPPMDVYETGDTFIVRVELPGIEPEQDVQIELVDNVLTIRGYRRDRSQRNKQHYHLAEVSYGPFERAVRLPVTMSSDRSPVRSDATETDPGQARPHLASTVKEDEPEGASAEPQDEPEDDEEGT